MLPPGYNRITPAIPFACGYFIRQQVQDERNYLPEQTETVGKYAIPTNPDVL